MKGVQFRDHLSGTNRTTDEKSMWALIKNEKSKGVDESLFKKIWKELIDEKYLIKSGKGYKWEM